MKFLPAFFTCSILCGCTANYKKEKTQLLTGLEVPDVARRWLPIRPSYASCLKKIKTEKATLQGKPIDASRAKLYKYISQDMPAYWVGTAWDFNGVTRAPKAGNIACGYFVTTILQDIGLPINRSRLAQQASSVMIKQLTRNIVFFSTITQLKNYVVSQPNYSVFIIGLDFHTGFIVKGKNNSYFFHSNYIGRQGVVMEKLESPVALKSSKSFMVGSLSANDKLMEKWLGN